jgi:protein-S-isoprenylcysteine O-methyltransferase Ste14
LSNLYLLLSVPILLLLLFLGLAIGGMGIAHIGRESYSPFPKPTKKNILSRRGIYKYIRHPMYAGLMLVGLALLLSRFTPLALVFFLLFATATFVKAKLEETLMEQLHPKYRDYKRQVKMFIPYLY